MRVGQGKTDCPGAGLQRSAEKQVTTGSSLATASGHSPWRGVHCTGQWRSAKSGDAGHRREKAAKENK